jgi:hypothetical protein
MAGNKDWLPGQKAGQLEKAAGWSGVLADKATDWGIPSAQVSALDTLILTAQNALHATEGAGRGPVATAACKAAFAALVEKMRYLKERYFFVPPLSDEDLVSLGLTPRDKHPSPIAPPTGNPGFEITPSGTRRLTVRVWDEDTGEKKRPYGMTGAVVRYVISDAPVEDMTLFTQSDLITKSPYIFTGTDAQRGKWISLAMCWQSETGGKGPWSEIQSTLIP